MIPPPTAALASEVARTLRAVLAALPPTHDPGDAPARHHVEGAAAALELLAQHR